MKEFTYKNMVSLIRVVYTGIGEILQDIRDAMVKSIDVGTVTTGEPGTDAQVKNSGTEQDIVLDFTIPRGEQGEQGERGPQGEQGPKGDTGTMQYEYDADTESLHFY